MEGLKDIKERGLRGRKDLDVVKGLKEIRERGLKREERFG